MRWAIALASGALLLAGCTSSTPPAGDPAGATAAAPVSTAAAATATPAGGGFASAMYGYSMDVPGTWTVTPATAPWDGGDIDHAADYADHLVDEVGNEYFVIAAPVNTSLSQAVDDHLTWLTENRGCPAPSVRTSTAIDGVAAERVAIHCPDGVFGPTLVSKAIAVIDGDVVIVSSFSPDEGSDDFAPFDALVSSIRWHGSVPTTP